MSTNVVDFIEKLIDLPPEKAKEILDAMDRMDSIPCGPAPDSCDVGHRCVNHGGETTQEDGR
jgi:hypothetical protein